MAIDEQDLTYARAGDDPSELRVYRDVSDSFGHAIVSVHGGTWTKNDRTSHMYWTGAWHAPGRRFSHWTSTRERNINFLLPRRASRQVFATCAPTRHGSASILTP